MEGSIEVKDRLIGFAAEQARLAEELRGTKRDLECRTRELEQSVSRFRDVIERNADAIVVVDREGRIRFANNMAAKLFGADQAALLDTPFGFPLVAGDTTEVDLLSRGAPRTAEMRVVESEWEGKTAYIASLRDVTERKRAEKNARQLIREQAARTVAEQAARRLRFLLESSTALAASLDYDATLSVLAGLCVSELADWAVVCCVDDAGLPARLEVAHCDLSKADLARELRDTPLPAADTHGRTESLKARKPLLVREASPDSFAVITRSTRHLELVRRLGVESLMIVPMIRREHLLGVLALVSADPSRHFEEQDLALAEDIAVRATLAIDSARLYQEVRRANQTKSDFLAVVSHDLRTPLTAIIGYAELLEMGVPEQLPPRALERVERIRTSARHLLYLLNELLAFARLDAGHEEVRLREIDVREIARDVATVMEPLAVERRLLLNLEMPERPLTLQTDPDKLRQVLLNLVGNAVKYTERGEVTIAVDRVEHLISIRVRDTGVGIAPDHLKLIFEPFWQVDPTRRSRDGGTGLGLSVVRHLANLLSAKISVASEIGQGTTFTVTLPDGGRNADGG